MESWFCKIVLGSLTFLLCFNSTTFAMSVLFALDSAPLTF
jgi:hypothetical protein